MRRRLVPVLVRMDIFSCSMPGACPDAHCALFARHAPVTRHSGLSSCSLAPMPGRGEEMNCCCGTRECKQDGGGAILLLYGSGGWT
ncbi:hypothetical protein SRHO_G00004590 [Serrasalmus rhombeus]